MKISCHEEEVQMWVQQREMGKAYGYEIRADHLDGPHSTFNTGAVFTIGNFDLKTLFTPGHTNGSVSFV